MAVNVSFDPDALATSCRCWKVSELALFGSVLRDDFDPQRSDVDVLVAFLPGADIGLFERVDMQRELAQLFGRSVLQKLAVIDEAAACVSADPRSRHPEIPW